MNMDYFFSLYRTIVSALISQDTLHKLKSCDILIICSDNFRGYTHQGKTYSPLIDSVVDLCIERGLTVETVDSPSSVYSGDYAYNCPVKYSRNFLYIIVLGVFIKLAKGSDSSREWVYRKLCTLWHKIFEKTKPSVVIGCTPQPYICRAAKQNNIRIYELQHGVIDIQNQWYSNLFSPNTNRSDRPDGFLVWNEESNKAIKSMDHNSSTNVITVGNPWFVRFKKRKENDELVQEAFKSKTIFDNKNPTILVTLQWGLSQLCYKDKNNFNGVMIQELEETILSTCNKYNWMLRLHPVQLRETYRGEGNSKKYLMKTFDHLQTIDWRQSSELPLPIVLMQTDLHLTDFSSTVIEASWFGIPSGILNLEFKPGGKFENFYFDERELGIAEVIPQNSEKIMQWIERQLSNTNTQFTNQCTDYDIESFIDDLLK